MLSTKKKTTRAASEEIAEQPESKKTKKTYDEDIIKTGFDRGYEAQKILGATDAGGELAYLIQWKDMAGLADLVPAREARLKIPDLIIAFYEQRLTFQSTNNST